MVIRGFSVESFVVVLTVGRRFFEEGFVLGRVVESLLLQEGLRVVLTRGGLFSEERLVFVLSVDREFFRAAFLLRFRLFYQNFVLFLFFFVDCEFFDKRGVVCFVVLDLLGGLTVF